MTTYIALLKGVNVGGNRMVPMAELRAALTERGYENVRTLLASGNVVLDTPTIQTATLESRLEADLQAAMGVTTHFMVRDAAEWAAILAANPFPQVAESDPGHLLVMVMKTEPDGPRARAYLDAYEGPETVAFAGREIFIHYPDGQGASRLALPKLGNGTARNWNTMRKLAALVEA